MRCEPVPPCIGGNDNNKPCSDQQSNWESTLPFRLRKYEICLAVDDTTIFTAETRDKTVRIQLHGMGIRPQEPHGIGYARQG
ncbi:hypothetical protein AA100600_1221 [Gluconobacter thailandicus F149-1 = NBRC 100600]|nr:hypothetical protein AA100600_1221 [Gluconobacter thailandicus F149-1 = NBRC 100600]